MNNIRALIILLLSSYNIFGQIIDYKYSLDTCTCSSIKYDRVAIETSKKDTVLLPLGWFGGFKGELPHLSVSKIYNDDTFYFRATIAWDVMYSPNNQFLFDKSDSLYDEIDTLKMEEFNFLLAVEKKYRYNNNQNILKLMYHVDNRKGTDNYWMWTFSLLSQKRRIPEFILCEVKAIIKQIIKAYQK